MLQKIKVKSLIWGLFSCLIKIFKYVVNVKVFVCLFVYIKRSQFVNIIKEMLNWIWIKWMRAVPKKFAK